MLDNTKNQINELLAREVTRAEFIKHTGMAILAVVGITSFLNTLHKGLLGTSKPDANRGYGSHAYGK